MVYHLPQDLIGEAKSWGEWHSLDGGPVDQARSDAFAWAMVVLVFRSIAASHGCPATLDILNGDIETDASEEQVMRWFDIAMEQVWEDVTDGLIPALPPLKP